MAKVSHRQKPKLWSKEMLRQRGVRVAVEVLRLRQAHQKLSHENTGYLKLNAVLRRHLDQGQLLNQSLRASLELRSDPTVRGMEKGNYWVKGNHSVERNGADSQNKPSLTSL